MFYPNVSDHSSYATVHVREHEKDRLEGRNVNEKVSAEVAKSAPKIESSNHQEATLFLLIYILPATQ